MKLSTLLLLLAPVAVGQSPDAIYINGHVLTVDARSSTAEAFAVRGNQFTAVGRTAGIRKLAGTATQIVDLKGRTVIPGFEDSHLHSVGGGPGVDLSAARTLADIYRAIGTRVASSPKGEVIVSNSDWHEAQLKEQRLPLRRDLDTVSPDHPLVLVRGGHEYILNSAALARWNITKATKSPDGGQISRYTDGEPNGELIDRARTLVTLPIVRQTAEQQIEFWTAQYRKMNEAGLTSVRHPGISLTQYEILKEMKKRGLLTVRVNALLSAPPDATATTVRSFLETSGIQPGEGDDTLRIVGMKLVVDGGFEGGWMRQPYAEPFGKDGTFRGLQLMAADRYTAIVKELNRMGWRVGTHAVGDAAMDQVLAAYEAANAEQSIVGKRWAIEHGFMPAEEHFARIKALGLTVTVQNHLYIAGPSLVNYWGAKRAAWTTPVKAYIDHGVDVAAGTDAPVVPYPPLWTLYHFVSRDTISGGVLGGDQRITRAQALRIATMGNAHLTFEEDTKGSIEPGKLADFVVLAEDLMAVPDKRIEKMKVLMTVVGGKTVYSDAAR